MMIIIVIAIIIIVFIISGHMGCCDEILSRGEKMVDSV